jgi:hypothetical protein
VEPARTLRLVARHRRRPFGRPGYTQLPIHKVKAWWDAKLASAPGAPGPSKAPAASARKPDRASRALLIASAALAVNFGAGLGLLGWGALQALGLVDEPAIESMQRKQTGLIAQLDATIDALHAAVAGLSARVYSAAEREEATAQRMAEIDADLGMLRTSMIEMRAAQDAWREPVGELTAVAAKTRGEIVRLRASLDELNRSRQPEVVAVNARIDRIEHAMVQHNLLGPLRGSIHEVAARRSPVALSESSPGADGHIINLTPGR